ncbi:MAG: hypothetical protein CVT86_02290 [Alphaproteobacteria bacterium HGW-Alphaproteobacteria-8]|nr:MAG: hypothetical protein CVT86_02290 [Alphaproteobacteria bacterium HGW-Alphaproteobacteria-8]
MTINALEQFSRRIPALAIRAHRAIATLLAQRLTRASAQRRASGDLLRAQRLRSLSRTGAPRRGC